MAPMPALLPPTPSPRSSADANVCSTPVRSTSTVASAIRAMPMTAVAACCAFAARRASSSGMEQEKLLSRMMMFDR